MWHKVSPLAFRIGYIKKWKSTGYANKSSYKDQVVLDSKIRTILKAEFKGIPVWNIFITHDKELIRVIIYTSKSSLVLGKNWENVERLENLLKRKFNKVFKIDVKEIKSPDTDAIIVAFSIARQIEKRMPYRRVIKQVIAKAREKWAKGIKVLVWGRLNWVDIARSETYKEGAIPTQSIRSDIEYATERADTVYWVIWIKVWIYKWDVIKK